MFVINKGKKQSDKTKLKRSRSMKGKNQGEKHGLFRAFTFVIRFETLHL